MSDNKLFLNIKKRRNFVNPEINTAKNDKIEQPKKKKKIFLRSTNTISQEKTQNKSSALENIPLTQGRTSNEQSLVLQPEINIFNQNFKTAVPLRAKARRTIIGSNKTSRVHIESPTVEARHLIIVDYENNNYFINGTNSNKDFLINGIESYQFKTNKSEHTFFKVGSVWGAFYHPKSQKVVPMKGHNFFSVKSADMGIINSEEKPLLLGSSPLADIYIQEAPDFIAIIYWNNKGILIDNLTGKIKSGLKVNNEMISTTHQLNNNSTISYLDYDLSFIIKGSVDLRIQELIKNHNLNQQLTLSTIDIKDKISKKIPHFSRPFTLGRLTSNDIIINNSYVSKLHCHLYRKGNNFTIKDNNSANHSYINGKLIFKEQLSPGDLLGLGECKMLLHYDTD